MQTQKQGQKYSGAFCVIRKRKKNCNKRNKRFACNSSLLNVMVFKYNYWKTLRQSTSVAFWYNDNGFSKCQV